METPTDRWRPSAVCELAMKGVSGLGFRVEGGFGLKVYPR